MASGFKTRHKWKSILCTGTSTCCRCGNDIRMVNADGGETTVICEGKTLKVKLTPKSSLRRPPELRLVTTLAHYRRYGGLRSTTETCLQMPTPAKYHAHGQTVLLHQWVAKEGQIPVSSLLFASISKNGCD